MLTLNNYQQTITTSPSHAKITWTVTAEEVRTRLEAAEKEIIKQLESNPADKFNKKHKRNKINRITELRGFRPNKFPRNLLWRKHGKEIQERVVMPLLRELWDNMMKDKPFRPVSQPQASSKTGPQHGLPMEVVIDVDIWPCPNIDKSRYSSLYLQVPAKEFLSDSQITQEIENRRRYYAKYLATEDGQEINIGDYVQLRIAEKHPGDEDFRPEQGIWCILGGGGIIPSLESAMVGHKKGEEIFGTVENSGAEVDIRMRIDDHKLYIPISDEALYQNEGVLDIYGLQEKVRLSLQEQIDLRYRNVIRHGIMTKIIGSDIFPIPQDMIKERAHILEQEAWITAMKKGNQFTPSEESRKQFIRLADAVLREEAVLRAVAENEGIKTDTHDIDAEIEKIAVRDGQGIQDIKEWIEKENISDRIENQIICNKALDFLINKVKISEVVTI